jgi:hypothetical protein
LNYIKTGLEKNIFRHAVANLSWEENLSSKTRDIQVGLRYDFSFSQSAVNAVIGNKTTTFIESAKGSLMADSHSHFLGVSNTSSVGKGGLVILTFLDMNCNGKYDQDEPKVTGLNLKLQGGRIFTDMKDSIIRVFDLQPFANYFLEFDANSFPNVAWQLRFRSMSTITNPNQFKLIEVPVYVFGEASGMVYTSENVSLQGIGRITVSFFDEKNNCVGKVLTEPDGYYSFLGLPPGTFTVRLDEEQLAKLKLSTAPVSRTITITKSKEGDLAGDLDFILKPGN